MAANINRRISVSWAASRYVWQKYDGIRIRIEVTAAVAMSANIFAYRLRPVNPQTGEAAGFFSHVCSPVDLEEYQDMEPRAGESPQWFKLPFVDVLLRSREEMDKFLADVLSDIRRLKRTLDIMDNVEPIGSTNIGADPLPESPVSSSSESSDIAGTSDSSSLSESPLLSETATSVAYDQTVGNGPLWTYDDGFVVTLLRGQSSRPLIVNNFDFRSLLPVDVTIDSISAAMHTQHGIANSSSSSESASSLSSSASSASDAVGSNGVTCDIPEQPAQPLHPVVSIFRPYLLDRGRVEFHDRSNPVIITTPGGTYNASEVRAPISYADVIRDGFGLMIAVSLPIDAAVEQAIVRISDISVTVYYR